MSMRIPLSRLAAVATAALLAACAQTSKVADTVDTGALAKGNKAIALMKVGSADASCQSVRVTLARADGDAYRETRTLTVVAPKRLSEPTVAEAELDPGAYHVVAYSCAMAKATATVVGRREGDRYATSLASFTLEPGEVVNVGFLQIKPLHRQVHLTRSYEWAIAVGDWPLSEIERFKSERPNLYAAMKTRLMTVTEAGATTPESCERARQLKAQGKLQNLPRECGATGAEPVPAARPAVGKTRTNA